MPPASDTPHETRPIDGDTPHETRPIDGDTPQGTGPIGGWDTRLVGGKVDASVGGGGVIGIVVVSHSQALATAAIALADEMVAPENRPVVVMAAGLGPDTFGTDAAAVAEAITEADGPDGVLVLLDLGSAVLSTELALEFVDPEVRDRVVVSGAPLVEGLVAAVVLASTGAPLDAVAEEARRGLAAKQEHIGDAGSRDSAESSGRSGEERTIEVQVTNPHGLHARPAAKLVALARSYDARLTVTDLETGRGPVDADSLSMVATLGSRAGHRLRIGAEGPESAAALIAIADLARTGFGDEPGPADRADDTTGHETTAGTTAPAGATDGGWGVDVAIGSAVVAERDVDLGGYVAGDVEHELRRSAEAVATVGVALSRLRDRTADRFGADEAGIFDAHLALLDDPAVTGQVGRAIRGGDTAPESWSVVLAALADEIGSLHDPYQRERAQDVRAVRRQILLALTGQAVDTHHGRGILVVPEIDAATAATADAEKVSGIATRSGGGTGHGVIVARSRGIPVITDIGDVEVPPGTLVGFDARSRRFVVDPDQVVQDELRAIADRRAVERADALGLADRPAVTVDGTSVRVLANVGSIDDARAAAEQGAEGSGLVRTEVLFGDRRVAPGVVEQSAAYDAIAEAFGGRPITIRTWDAGGDKPLRFLPLQPEPNPFLGARGLRVFRRHPDLLRAQLEAICRTARTTPVRVMFPMVTTQDETAWAVELLRSAAGGTLPTGLEVGIMVEVPAAALRIGRLAAGLDFVSIGTNDLTQYVTAADRGNSAVAGLADGLDPAVLTLIGRIVRDVPPGVEVAVCGDLASDPDAAVLLVGLGVRELSAIPPQVPLVKARLREIRSADAASLAAHATSLPSATEVRQLTVTSGAASPPSAR